MEALPGSIALTKPSNKSPNILFSHRPSGHLLRKTATSPISFKPSKKDMALGPKLPSYNSQPHTGSNKINQNYTNYDLHLTTDTRNHNFFSSLFFSTSEHHMDGIALLKLFLQEICHHKETAPCLPRIDSSQSPSISAWIQSQGCF